MFKTINPICTAGRVFCVLSLLRNTPCALSFDSSGLLRFLAKE